MLELHNIIILPWPTGDIQIIGMSATIGNMQEIGNFLDAHVYMKDFRPVHLTETIKINDDIFVINKDIDGSLKTKLDRKMNFDVSIYISNATNSVFFINKYLFFLKVYSSDMKRLDPSGIGILVREILPNGSCLVFCPTKSSCQSIAKIIYKVIGQ